MFVDYKRLNYMLSWLTLMMELNIIKMTRIIVMQLMIYWSENK